MPEGKKVVICEDEHLGEALKKSAFGFVDALEKQLKEQANMGLPVEEGLKNVKKARRYLRQVLK